MGLIVLGVFLIVYGVFCLGVGIFKWPFIWNLGKIQGFVKILGNIGTMIFISVWGAAALGVGIWLVAR